VVGNLGQGGDGGGMRKGRSVYEQPGTKVDRVASCQRRVSKYVKGNKGKLTGNGMGSKNRDRELRYNLCCECTCVYIVAECLNEIIT
jgi:hypothetical protein